MDRFGSPTQNEAGSSPAICASSMNCSGFISWLSSTKSARVRWRKAARTLGSSRSRVIASLNSRSKSSTPRLRHSATGLLRASRVRGAVEPLTQCPADLLLQARQLPLLEFDFALFAQLLSEEGHDAPAAGLDGEGLQVDRKSV